MAEEPTIKAKTLEEMGDDWTPYGVSLVENPAVPKAKFLVVKEQQGKELGMPKSYLHDRRSKLRLSQEQLAEKSGVSQGRISDWERGQRGLSLEQAQKLEPVLKVSAGKLAARHVGDLAVAMKGQEGGRGKIHRAIGDLEDLADNAEDGEGEEESAIREAIKELKAVVEGDKPAGDTVEKAASGSKRGRNEGRTADGRRRRGRAADGSLETAEKSGDRQRERNAFSGKRKTDRRNQV